MNLKKISKFLFVGTILFTLSERVAALEFNAEVKDSNTRLEKINFLSNNSMITVADSNLKAPTIKTNLRENINKIDFNAALLDSEKDSYNFIVFYSIDENNNITELFRSILNYSGDNSITDYKVLSKIKNNDVLFARVESFKVKNNTFEHIKNSKRSELIYTPKSLKLNILADNKEVHHEEIFLNSEADKEGNIKIDLQELKTYSPDKFYKYEQAVLKIADKKIVEENSSVKIPYFTKEITLELAKNLTQWRKISVKYPNEFDILRKEYLVKNNITVKEFLNGEGQELNNYKFNNEYYKFSGYSIGNIDIKDYKGNIIENFAIKAKYSTKIIVDNGKKEDVYYLTTGEKLKDIDLSLYEKDNYIIENYTLINNVTLDERTVENIDEEVVDDSVTIKINYKEKTHKVTIAQDDYNKRFGKVEQDILNEVSWSEISPIGELLEQLRAKIMPSKGYELQFRINKKVVDGENYITKDSILEIYFKKIDNQWVNVQFVGEGIDKFLSDGQEVLAGDRIDTINLPTSQGAAREFLGWRANRPYKVDINGEVIVKDIEDILKLSDLPHIITTASEDLIFTAVYRELYEISIVSNGRGEVTFNNKNNKNFEVKQGYSIKDNIASNTFLLLPKPHYKFAYFTSKNSVLVNNGHGELKIIEKGGKINLQDFYNIAPNSNLEFTAHFIFYNGLLDFENMLTTDDINNVLKFDVGKDYETNLEAALGPLYFLR